MRVPRSGSQRSACARVMSNVAGQMNSTSHDRVSAQSWIMYDASTGIGCSARVTRPSAPTTAQVRYGGSNA